MKISFVILIVFLVLIVKFSVIATNNHQQLHSKDRNHVEGLKKSFYDVLKVFFVDRKVRFDVIVLGNVSQRLIDVVNYIGDALLDKLSFPVHIKRIPNLSDWHDDIFIAHRKKIKQSAFIILTPKAMELFDKFTDLRSDFPKEIKVFIYGHDGSFTEATVQSLNTFTTSKPQICEYFLHDSGDSLTLITYEWYSSEICNKIHKKEINRFDFATLKWKNELIFYEKFTNYHQCTVVVDTIKANDYLVAIAAEKVNFNELYDRISFHYIRNLIMNARPIFEGIASNHYTTTFAEEEYNFVITPGMQYTPYEKMLLPFDKETWWYLITTFGGAFAVIFFVNLMPITIKNIIYGIGVRVPAFNVIGTFFGIGQQKLPGNNFGRIILITFILFCLVIRTAYQGVQFNMMTKIMRRPQPKTIDELFEKNITIILVDEPPFDYKVASYKFRGVYGVHKNVITKSQYNIRCVDIFNDAKREVFLFEEFDNLYYTKRCLRKLEHLNQIFMRIPVGFQIDKNHFMFDTIQNITRNLIPAGIPQHMHQRYLEDQYKKFEFPPEKGPQVLTVPGLSFGFVIWLVACGVSTIVLFGEIITWLVSKRKRNMNQENENIILNQVNIEEVEEQVAAVLINQNEQEKNKEEHQEPQENQNEQEQNVEVIEIGKNQQKPNQGDLENENKLENIVEIDQNLHQYNQLELQHIIDENQDEELAEVVVDTQKAPQTRSDSKTDNFLSILTEINAELDQEENLHDQSMKRENKITFTITAEVHREAEGEETPNKIETLSKII